MSATWIKLFAGFGAGVLVTIFSFNLPKNSSEWASWIQAFGSIGAILIAVWVLYEQNKHSIKRAEEEVDQLVLGLGDEVRTLLEGFKTLNAVDFMQNPDKAYLRKIPMSEGAFVVYNNSASQIGKVKKPELRRQIVLTYARAFGFIRSMQLNKTLVEDWERAKRANENSTETKELLAQLTDYGPKLRNLYTGLLSDAEKLLSMIPK